MKQEFVRKILKIGGMSCPGCEMRIESSLKKIRGVKEVKADYARSAEEVAYDPECISLNRIVKAIEKLGYTVRNQPNSAGKQKEEAGRFSAKQWIAICILLLAGYFIIKNTVGFNFIPEISQQMGYGVLFVVGLLTSLHCVAMCGGINLSQCVSRRFPKQEGSKYSGFRPSLLYNAGRVVSYTIIGGIAGALGSVVGFSGAAKGTIAVIAGILMMLIGLNMLDVFPQLRKWTPRLPKKFSDKIHAETSGRGPLYVGLLNGLMPCAPLQAMQLYALGSGTALAGAASMLVFSLGTVPLMFGLGAFSSFLSSRSTRRMRTAGAVLVVALGIVMLSRGFSLSGVSLTGGILPNASNTDGTATLEGNVQTITTKLQPRSYSPLTVQKGVPVRWIIEADAGAINGCNGTIIIPKYNISKTLKPGENEIQFTPDAEGIIPYSCWMGMIRSSITVVSDDTDS